MAEKSMAEQFFAARSMDLQASQSELSIQPVKSAN
jgi:hypothetical protein